jgi:hypothetical protein
MITHNGTYLGAATHHGMPIYAATMGGKMVIGGWLLSATKQAIVAAFGAEGTEVIRKTNDYLNRIATTDPQRALQISGFINEDPLLVCSLVETSKTRWLKSDGLAYVKTGIIASNNSYMKMRFIVLETGNDKVATISYADQTSGARAFGIGSWDSVYLTNYGSYQFFSKKVIEGDIIEYTNNKGEISLKYDGKEETKKMNASFTCPSEMIVPGLSRNGNFNPASAKGIGVFEYHIDGIDLVPFNGADRIGMLDLNTLQFYPNANTSGSFTIQITDK